jgi:hypothetical protein
MLATVLHIDPLETIARINMDRATERTDKNFWKKLAGVAALLFVTVVLPLPATAWAPEPLNTNNTIHYTKLKKLTRFLSRQLRTILLNQKPLEVRHGSPALLAA